MKCFPHLKNNLTFFFNMAETINIVFNISVHVWMHESDHSEVTKCDFVSAIWPLVSLLDVSITRITSNV